ncbi:NAD(P)H-binding protein [Pedobacter endophyticus]|uniref:NAD(P)H-binding protein n=1 Tax=Pedobacter endophyticus TaxID=2789740 RepID=A0A7S9PZI5_9SPHI|nr:NAD(P)H-binding protein [Pedobacter endophyticus]QPH40388.1 NAD(P)H-binding protein [Pedobacter endophyticus]
MLLITGATGNIGQQLIDQLTAKQRKPVIALTRDASKAKELFPVSTEIKEVDVLDTPRLTEVFAEAEALFILNPPADVSTDIDLEERKTVKSILEALKSIPTKRVVVQSTLGNQPGEHIADLGVLYALEQGIKTMHHDYHIIRPAYYISNWKPAIATAKENGFITSFYPEDFRMPMVAPRDIAKLAAELLTQERSERISNIVGPTDYSPADVAAALSNIFNKEIKVKVIDEKDWEGVYQSLGFSPQAAHSYTNMTRITLKGGVEYPEDAVVGETSIEEYLRGCEGLLK